MPPPKPQTEAEARAFERTELSNVPGYPGGYPITQPIPQTEAEARAFERTELSNVPGYPGGYPIAQTAKEEPAKETISETFYITPEILIGTQVPGLPGEKFVQPKSYREIAEEIKTQKENIVEAQKTEQQRIYEESKEKAVEKALETPMGQLTSLVGTGLGFGIVAKTVEGIIEQKPAKGIAMDIRETQKQAIRTAVEKPEEFVAGAGISAGLSRIAFAKHIISLPVAGGLIGIRTTQVIAGEVRPVTFASELITGAVLGLGIGKATGRLKTAEQPKEFLRETGIDVKITGVQSEIIGLAETGGTIKETSLLQIGKISSDITRSYDINQLQMGTTPVKTTVDVELPTRTGIMKGQLIGTTTGMEFEAIVQPKGISISGDIPIKTASQLSETLLPREFIGVGKTVKATFTTDAPVTAQQAFDISGQIAGAGGTKLAFKELKGFDISVTGIRPKYGETLITRDVEFFTGVQKQKTGIIQVGADIFKAETVTQFKAISIGQDITPLIRVEKAEGIIGKLPKPEEGIESFATVIQRPTKISPGDLVQLSTASAKGIASGLRTPALKSDVKTIKGLGFGAGTFQHPIQKSIIETITYSPSAISDMQNQFEGQIQLSSQGLIQLQPSRQAQKQFEGQLQIALPKSMQIEFQLPSEAIGIRSMEKQLQITGQIQSQITRQISLLRTPVTLVTPVTPIIPTGFQRWFKWNGWNLDEGIKMPKAKGRGLLKGFQLQLFFKGRGFVPFQSRLGLGNIFADIQDALRVGAAASLKGAALGFRISPVERSVTTARLKKLPAFETGRGIARRFRAFGDLTFFEKKPIPRRRRR